jgi:DNA ligase (NAD+)
MSVEQKEIIKNLQTNFFATIHSLTKQQLETTIHYLSDLYYNVGVSPISDEDYDRLRETLIRKFGHSKVAEEVGAEPKVDKLKLPFFMGSMDKIKPNKNNLDSWLTKYRGPFSISDKLDGMSALVVKNNEKRALYSRGNGIIGQDISRMLNHIHIGDMKIDTYAVRGELIISKAKYAKVAEGRRGARQMVIGLANQKGISKEMALIDFVAYEVILPEGLKPTDQFKLLQASTFLTAPNGSVDTINIEILGELLTKRKMESEYEIDGIIVANDVVYPRRQSNPDHAFAFKMAFADQETFTEILEVQWNASKDGYLKPTLKFEPVNIGGSVIQFATGFNAAWVESNAIGPGAFVEIIRSGDVIPYVKAVKSPSPTGPQMPAVKWHWNKTHVDAIVDNVGEHPEVQKRALLHFATNFGISFCGEGTIARLYDGGHIKTIPQLLRLDKATLLKVDGFKDTSATKLLVAIADAKSKATHVEYAVGSGIFERGVGAKKIEQAFKYIPENLEPSPELIGAIAKMPGWSIEGARTFVGHLPAFKQFMHDLGAVVAKRPPSPVKMSSSLSGQVILFTGFHPKDLEESAKAKGATISSAFSGKVTLLVVKDEMTDNEKTKQAKAKGIHILTGADFRKML